MAAASIANDVQTKKYLLLCDMNKPPHLSIQSNL